MVFIDPQVMLDKVSEPIEFMFELREPEDQDECTSEATAADNHPPSDSDKQSPLSTDTATAVSTLAPQKTVCFNPKINAKKFREPLEGFGVAFVLGLHQQNCVQ